MILFGLVLVLLAFILPGLFSDSQDRLEGYLDKNANLIRYALIQYPNRESLTQLQYGYFQLDLALTKGLSEVEIELFALCRKGDLRTVPVASLSEIDGHVGAVFSLEQVSLTGGCSQFSEDRGETITLAYGLKANKTLTDRGSIDVKLGANQGFRFAASSCAQTGSQSLVFDSMTKKNIQHFVQMGDIHYGGSRRLKQEDFEFALYEVFRKNPTQAEFYRTHSLSYMFDDHDIGQNNADGRSRTISKATKAYQTMIRAIPERQEKLEMTSPGSPAYHSYLTPVGDGQFLKFIVLDVRTMKNGTQNYGEEQLNWFQEEVESAQGMDGQDGRQMVPGVIIVHGFPWHSCREFYPFHDATLPPEIGSCLTDEKARISQIIEDSDFNRERGGRFLAMISGDIHMMTYQAPLHSPATEDHFPLFQYAPMDKTTSCMGCGRYSGTPSYNKGQYCLFEYSTRHPRDPEDAKDRHCLNFEGFSFDEKVMQFSTCSESTLVRNATVSGIVADIREAETIKADTSDLEAQFRELTGLKYQTVKKNKKWAFGMPLDCPVKKKHRAQFIACLTGAFAALIMAFNVIRKVCPRMVE